MSDCSARRQTVAEDAPRLAAYFCSPSYALLTCYTLTSSFLLLHVTSDEIFSPVDKAPKKRERKKKEKCGKKRREGVPNLGMTTLSLNNKVIRADSQLVLYSRHGIVHTVVAYAYSERLMTLSKKDVMVY